MGRETFKKKITSPELLERVNQKNKNLQRQFLNDKGRTCSPKTIENYESDLNIFFCWVVENADNKYFPDLKKVELSDFFSFCVMELRWNGSRFNRVRSVLSGLSDVFMKYYDEDYPTFKNIINALVEKMPKEPVREKTVLQSENIDFLMDQLSADELLNQACFLALAIYSGARVAELVSFKINYIDLDLVVFDGLFLETTCKIRTKGKGRQGKMLEKYITRQKFVPIFEKWLKRRQEIVEKTGSRSDALFLQNNGIPVQISTVNSWMERWTKIVGQPIYPHCFRHYFVTDMVKAGISKDMIMVVVGWSTDMVDIYTDIKDSEKDWSKDIAKFKASGLG